MGEDRGRGREREKSRDRVFSDDESDTHETGSTRPPSTVPGSATVSRSVKSLANSSSSSYGPGPTNGGHDHSVSNGNGLPALQTKGATEHDGLEPLAEEEVDPGSFDLVVPLCETTHGAAGLPRKKYSLEARSDLLFSTAHLRAVFADPVLLRRFADFLHAARPASSVALLRHYLDALKALRAIRYANAVVAALAPVLEGEEREGEREGAIGDGFDAPVPATANEALEARARDAFEVLVREDLPAYVTHTWIRIVSATIKKRIADTLPAHLKDMCEGLAEVFCLTDPSRPDNPIVFASEGNLI